MAETKEKKGYTWVKAGESGYWSKNTGPHHSHKLSVYCPYEKCRKITGTVDNEHLLNFGVCRECHTMYIADRKTPIIDVEFYQKRYQERGY